MQDLLKQKEQLEQQLAALNKKIEEEQKSENLISEIKRKAKELESLLLNAVLIKVHYLEESNKLLVTEYFDLDHAKAKEYDADYEEILYEQQYDDLHKALNSLNIAIKNHEIIDTKLYIRDSEPLIDDYEFDLDNLIYDNTMTIQFSDQEYTSLPEPFDLISCAEVRVLDSENVNITVNTKITYNYDIEKKYSTIIDGIHFKNNYTNRSDYTIHSEELVCKLENVDVEEIYSTLSNIRNIAFSNSHIVKSLLELNSRV